MIGQTISHYKILEKIGEGGMGVVYKAEDRKLMRTVALKFLLDDAFDDDHQRSRFIREAQTAAALDHPNICTIYEIDEKSNQIFISMSYIEGRSLRDKLRDGPFDLEEVRHTLSEVARGLDAAHKKDIYHCDINLTNIMVTNEGQTKIMDFGLATIVGTADLKTSGKMFGTMVYMSPEQIRGDTIDHRTDIWSLGICAYEMLTGQLPFSGDYGPAIFYSILNEEPRPVSALRADVPVELGRLVHKAIAKDPNERYATAGDLLSDLESMGKETAGDASVTSGAAPAIAVLPFTNMSADRDQDYFCDGIAEDIINGLTHVEGLRVVARTSAFAFKGRSEDIREIGKKLSVDVLLEGSVRKWQDKLRITAQLISVKDGYHLWSERFDREMKDVFAIQDEISQAIVDMLKIKLMGEERKLQVKRYTKNLDAYSFYLKGRYYWNKRSEEGLRKGLECFEAAIGEDGNYALAYAGLADSYNLLGFYGCLQPAEAFPKAEEAVMKALEIDEEIAEARTSLAFAKMFYDWDWKGAESEFKRAIELTPNYSTAHHWYAEYLVLTAQMEEAIARSKKALESDPLSLIINTLLGWIPHYQHDFSEAVVQYRKTLEMDSRFVPAHFFLGLTYIQGSKYREAIAEFQEAATLFGESSLFLAAEGYAQACSGHTDDAKRILGELETLSKEQNVPSYYIAAIHLGLGDIERAFEWLENACEQRDHWLGFLKVDPIWNRLRSDQRFDDLMRRIGFPE